MSKILPEATHSRLQEIIRELRQIVAAIDDGSLPPPTWALGQWIFEQTELSSYRITAEEAVPLLCHMVQAFFQARAQNPNANVSTLIDAATKQAQEKVDASDGLTAVCTNAFDSLFENTFQNIAAFQAQSQQQVQAWIQEQITQYPQHNTWLQDLHDKFNDWAMLLFFIGGVTGTIGNGLIFQTMQAASEASGTPEKAFLALVYSGFFAQQLFTEVIFGANGVIDDWKDINLLEKLGLKLNARTVTQLTGFSSLLLNLVASGAHHLDGDPVVAGARLLAGVCLGIISLQSVGTDRDLFGISSAHPAVKTFWNLLPVAAAVPLAGPTVLLALQAFQDGRPEAALGPLISASSHVLFLAMSLFLKSDKVKEADIKELTTMLVEFAKATGVIEKEQDLSSATMIDVLNLYDTLMTAKREVNEITDAEYNSFRQLKDEVAILLGLHYRADSAKGAFVVLSRNAMGSIGALPEDIASKKDGIPRFIAQTTLDQIAQITGRMSGAVVYEQNGQLYVAWKKGIAADQQLHDLATASQLSLEESPWEEGIQIIQLGRFRMYQDQGILTLGEDRATQKKMGLLETLARSFDSGASTRLTGW
jgi:hypothetical protein